MQHRVLAGTITTTHSISHAIQIDMHNNITTNDKRQFHPMLLAK